MVEPCLHDIVMVILDDSAGAMAVLAENGSLYIKLVVGFCQDDGDILRFDHFLGLCDGILIEVVQHFKPVA